MIDTIREIFFNNFLKISCESIHNFGSDFNRFEENLACTEIVFKKFIDQVVMLNWLYLGWHRHNNSFC